MREWMNALPRYEVLKGMKYLVTGGSGFIGTHLIEELLARNCELLNIDIAPPKIETHGSFWKQVDILDPVELQRAFLDFMPTHVIHLAARTDTDGHTLDGYEVNTKGTGNVLAAIKATGSVQRVIITSTQFVNQYHGTPRDEFDFAPHTAYGKTKVITEQLTRQAELEPVWTIIRPTNIWGPWHLRYPHEFWRILGKGLYFHPGNRRIVRSYGYVKNVVYQIMRIFASMPEAVSSRVYYVGDEPIELLAWVNGFSVRQTGRRVRVVPAVLLRALALFGDALALLHVRFPLTSSRFRSMTTSNAVSMAETIKAFGQPPFSLEDGIEDTVKWLRLHYPEIVKTEQPPRFD
jgi:nucleoside-diphosphate-sugar epimerase